MTKMDMVPDDLLTQGRCLVEAGEFCKVYDPSVGEVGPWYINDHCFIRDREGVWHMFGITHAEPLHPMDEKNLAHATAVDLKQNPWTKQPFALSADRENWNEFHLWAPQVIFHAGLYYMFVCVGDADSRRYKIHLATSPDLKEWTRHADNPMVVDGFDARDPYVMRLKDRWVLYYTATSRPDGGNHVVACVTSTDLVHWSDKRVVFVDTETGTSGGSTESPSVIRRGNSYYLFICNNDRRGGYDATDVYLSRDPFHWSMENRVGVINAHAPEVIRDVDGQWYVSHCGWGRGGLYMAPLYWRDEENEADVSLTAGWRPEAKPLD